ncbi:hypothetical protein SEA_CHOTABHAI_64 [Mycobacterium phage ChotaBhai]|nr:hypothetical protein SEA_CHOTABHAI_64 [Mycobacterium phage ChotaBhai]
MVGVSSLLPKEIHP